MGTYDTRGGSPSSPDEPDSYIFPEEEEVGGILEETGLDQTTIDKVVAVVRRVCEERFKERDIVQK